MRIPFVLIIFLAPLLALSSCAPYPHTSTKFGGMSGKVVDSNSGKPIQNVLVAIKDKPSISTKTNSAGEFVLPKRRNFHLFLYIGHGGSIPSGGYYSPEVILSHERYLLKRFKSIKNTNENNSYVDYPNISIPLKQNNLLR